jgi:hypothetical protein
MMNRTDDKVKGLPIYHIEDRWMVQSTKNKENAITKRLDIIIRLLMEEQRITRHISKNQQILSLHSLGLTAAEIAPMVGWGGKNLSNQIYKLLNQEMKKGRKNV